MPESDHESPRDLEAGRATTAPEASDQSAAAAGPEAPSTPPAAAAVFGDRTELAEQFVAILVDTGISHGLIGPREAPRLWDRHVLNCAAAHLAIPLAPAGQRVIDVGSGAGLPGLALAIARPDLELHLVEPLTRRTGWLTGTVAQLGLENVIVHTARAEALWDRLDAEWVTARAVSGIVQLAEWTLPLLRPHGQLVAIKGSRAESELDETRTALARLGVVDASVERLGVDLLDEPTTVIRLAIGASVDRRRFRAQGATSAGSARRRGDRPRAKGAAAPARRGSGSA